MVHTSRKQFPAEKPINEFALLSGRVMDPETMYDAVANVAIKDGRITAITKERIAGKESIDASGHVVAPGSIDTHHHATEASIGRDTVLVNAMRIQSENVKARLMQSRIRTPARRLTFVCLILFGTLPPSLARCDEEEASVQFYFVQITDTHFGKDDNNQRARKAIESINHLPMKIEFVAETGDLTHEKLADETVVAEAIEVLGELKVPVHHVPGNHDIVRREHEALAAIYKRTFGEFITEKEYHGVVCLFVYTEPLAKNFQVEGFDPIRELRDKLDRANGKPVLVFHHTPCVEDFYENKMHPGWDSQIRAAWIELLNEHNVKGVFAGHFHRDEFHWLGKVPLYVSSSVGDTLRRNRQATYRLYEYKNGRISYRTQYLK